MPLFEKPHTEHEKHLCKKIESGVTLEEYKKLVKDPGWICRQCGRAAASAAHICDPVPLQ